MHVHGVHHGVVCTCGETHRAEARAHDDGRCAARERLHDRLGRGHVRRRVEAHDARRVVRRHTEAQRGGAAAELARVRPDGLSDGALRRRGEQLERRAQHGHHEVRRPAV